MNLYDKYFKNNSITISYDEILNDFCQIKPTFNPILDICTIKTYGSYITNKITGSDIRELPFCTKWFGPLIGLKNEYED